MMMPDYFRNAVAAGLVLAQLTSAQLFSDCNPTKTSGCPPNPAVGDKAVHVDFTQGASDHFSPVPGTSLSYDSEKGVVFSIHNESDAPTMVSNEYIFYGRVDVVFQAAPGKGIVTAVTLQSENLDEIDLEWVGSNHGSVQSNYFSAGITGNYDRGGHHSINGDAMTTMHKYSLIWMPDKLEWLIDDVLVRTLIRDDNVKPAYRYPQTPSRIRLGTWVAGKEGQSQGTIDWAGGLADFSKAPFNAYLKSVTFSDYANGVARAKEYVWTDTSGLDSSIKVVTKDEAASSISSSVASSHSSTTKATSNNHSASTATTASSDTMTTDVATTGATTTDATTTDTASNMSTSPALGTSKGSHGNSGEDDDDECEDDEDSGPVYVSSTVVVIPTSAVITATRGTAIAVTTIISHITVTVPCDEYGNPVNTHLTSSGLGSGSPVTTPPISSQTPATTLTSLVKTPAVAGVGTTASQTGWKPVVASGVGFVPVMNGEDGDTQGSGSSGSGSFNNSTSPRPSTASAPFVHSSVTSPPGSTSGLVLASAASCFLAKGLPGLIGIIGAFML